MKIKRRPYSERKVLSLLGISDFRHLSKDNVMSFASNLDRMDPEVAKKAIEQFPNLSTAAYEALKDYGEVVEKVIEENGKNAESLHSLYIMIMQTLQNEFGKEDTPFEEKKYWLEQMKEVAALANEAVKETRTFDARILLATGVIAVIATGILSSTLGTNINIKNPTPKSLNG